MSITRKLMLAGAIAICAGAAAPQSRGVVDPAPAVESVAAALTPALEQGAQSMMMTAMEMQAVRGDGFWKKLFKAVVKVIKWIFSNPPPPPGCQTVPCPIEQPPTVWEENVFDASLAEDVIDTFENEIVVNEFYDDEAAFNEGRMSSSSQSETGFVFISRTGGGGGGGGGGCDSGCELMY